MLKAGRKIKISWPRYWQTIRGGRTLELRQNCLQLRTRKIRIKVGARGIKKLKTGLEQ